VFFEAESRTVGPAFFEHPQTPLFAERLLFAIKSR